MPAATDEYDLPDLPCSTPSNENDIIYPSIVPFVTLHFACFAAIWTGISFQSLVICTVLYWLRIFSIGAAYHRYFSHRSFKTSRGFQFILAFMAQTTAQKSVLWWASKHRYHHLHSDTIDDVHSPRHLGVFQSHVGWIFVRKHDKTNLSKVADFSKYRELLWLHKFELLPAVILGLFCLLIGGWSGLVVGFCWSTVLVYHATFCINSLAHLRGNKRYVTGDDSRNNWLLALITMGEGWHNNHHAYQSSVRQGFRWWEWDPTFYMLKIMSFLGIIWDLKTPPAHVLLNQRRLGMRAINFAARELAARFCLDRVVTEVFPNESTIEGLKDALRESRIGAAASILKEHLVNLPTRDDLLAEARVQFSTTPSVEEIVDRAQDLILRSIALRLLVTPELTPAL